MFQDFDFKIIPSLNISPESISERIIEIVFALGKLDFITNCDNSTGLELIKFKI